MQAALRIFYPPQCITCDALVTTDFGLCGACWRDTPFLSGLVCDSCGVPLIGDEAPDSRVKCDGCRALQPPWSRGRAALAYEGRARNLVLKLKHGDRTDLVKPAVPWMLRAAAAILARDMLVAPIPLHWWRLLRRRYNQAALLSAELARAAHLQHAPDLLRRARYTQSQEGRDHDGRFANLEGALVLGRGGVRQVQGRHVLLVDDVMTSGATFTAAAQACLDGGAQTVSILALARAVKRM